MFRGFVHVTLTLHNSDGLADHVLHTIRHHVDWSNDPHSTLPVSPLLVFGFTGFSAEIQFVEKLDDISPCFCQ